jgi:hypothetical protein
MPITTKHVSTESKASSRTRTRGLRPQGRGATGAWSPWLDFDSAPGSSRSTASNEREAT